MINEDFSTRTKFQEVIRWYITRYVESVAQKLPEGSSILDAGAGESVYKRFFSHCDYKAIDLAVGDNRWNYSNLDYVAPLDDMPIADNTFDAVLCTQVLEHLEWPRECVKEMYRVLKPGGKLYITAPMAQDEHQIPYDFFRYTSYGLKSICKNAGFKEVKTTPFGGIWVRWAQELTRCLAFLPSTGLRRMQPNLTGIALLPIKVFIMAAIPLLKMIFLWLDRYDDKKTDPIGWACEATK
jgi:SAM-dependent methyltransferase